MRIKDLISENDVLGQIKKDYQRGYDAVDKILNPRRWGEGPSSSNRDTANLDQLDIKDTVSRVINGARLYDQDQQLLKTLSVQIKTGEMPTKQNAQSLAIALKTAAQSQTVSDSQRALLSQFLKEL